MEADDFFANLSSDVVTDAISASTPTKRGESSAEKAESEQTIARGDPATEVPKLEYSEVRTQFFLTLAHSKMPFGFSLISSLF